MPSKPNDEPAIAESSLAGRPNSPIIRHDGNRVLGLDILRFIAVSLVIFRHMELLKPLPDAGKSSIWLQKIVAALHSGGWVGVDIFFVLSGFLVSGLIFREWNQRRSVSIGRFLLRRGLKIYPAFWFFLTVMVILNVWWRRPVNLRNILGELLFLQNYWANMFNHTWSLAVEEHFYLLCAAGVWLLLRFHRKAAENPFRSIPLLFLLVAIFCLATRLASNVVFPPTRVRLLFFCTHIRIDSLFFGVLLSYFWHFHYSDNHNRLLKRHRYFLVLAGVALLVPMFFQEPFAPGATWIRVDGFVLCYLAGGALLFGCLKIFEGTTSLIARFFAFLGRNSYSTYLWHQFGIGLAAPLFLQRTHSAIAWLGYCLLSHTAAWIVGIAAARLVEFPVLKLRDYWFPSLTTRNLRD